MNIHWSLELVPSAESKCYERVPPSPGASTEQMSKDGYIFSPEDNLWVRLRPQTMAVIGAGIAAHLDRLTQRSLPEWLYRLDVLYDLGFSFLSVTTPEGDIPRPLAAADLLPLIGLRVDVQPWSDSAFDAHARRLRMAGIEGSLKRELSHDLSPQGPPQEGLPPSGPRLSPPS